MKLLLEMMPRLHLHVHTKSLLQREITEPCCRGIWQAQGCVGVCLCVGVSWVYHMVTFVYVWYVHTLTHTHTQDLGGVCGQDVPLLARPQPVGRVALHEEVRPRRLEDSDDVP